MNLLLYLPEFGKTRGLQCLSSFGDPLNRNSERGQLQARQLGS